MTEGWILGVGGTPASPPLLRFALRDEAESAVFTEALGVARLPIGRELHPFTSAPVAWTVRPQELEDVVDRLDRFADEGSQSQRQHQAEIALELANRYRQHAEWCQRCSDN